MKEKGINHEISEHKRFKKKKKGHLLERRNPDNEQGTGNQNDVRLSQPQPMKL